MARKHQTLIDAAAHNQEENEQGEGQENEQAPKAKREKKVYADAHTLEPVEAISADEAEEGYEGRIKGVARKPGQPYTVAGKVISERQRGISKAPVQVEVEGVVYQNLTKALEAHDFDKVKDWPKARAALAKEGLVKLSKVVGQNEDGTDIEEFTVFESVVIQPEPEEINEPEAA